jgi:hypothetical protein
MWRAYGRGTGVGIVLNQEPFFGESNAFKAYSTPVAYLKSDEFLLNLNKIAKTIEESASFLKSLDKNIVKTVVINALRFAVVSTKHCGFSEEKEWRVIYSPNIEKSPHLTHSIENIDGVPQEIYKFPIKDIPNEGVTGLDLKGLINRVIIGPTQHPFALYKAFVKTLGDAGIEDPHAKVSISDIPLRR